MRTVKQLLLQLQLLVQLKHVQQLRILTSWSSSSLSSSSAATSFFFHYLLLLLSSSSSSSSLLLLLFFPPLLFLFPFLLLLFFFLFLLLLFLFARPSLSTDRDRYAAFDARCNLLCSTIAPPHPCDVNNGGCCENADCVRLEYGDYKCVCKPGYERVGCQCKRKCCSSPYMRTASLKTAPYYICNNFVKLLSILIILGKLLLQ